MLLTVAILTTALWYSGTFDAQLDPVGLSRSTCAQEGSGSIICGDDLVVFCKENYSAANANTCDKAFREAGVDPGAVPRAREEAQEEYEDCVQQSLARNRSAMPDCPTP